MCVPACFPWNHIAFHSTVSWNHIFNNTCQYVSNMRFSVSCRRSVVKSICRAILSVFHTLSENIMFFPELFYSLLTIYKLKISVNFFIHINPPYKVFFCTQKTRYAKRIAGIFYSICLQISSNCKNLSLSV